MVLARGICNRKYFPLYSFTCGHSEVWKETTFYIRSATFPNVTNKMTLFVINVQLNWYLRFQFFVKMQVLLSSFSIWFVHYTFLAACALIRVEDRVECGTSQTKHDCFMRGCCWDHTGNIKCFKVNAGMLVYHFW